MADPSKPAIITRESLVPIGLVIAMLAGAGYLVSEWSAVKYSIEGIGDDLGELSDEVEGLSRTLDTSADDRWRRTEMRGWVEEFATKNPSLIVPPVRDF